MIVYRIGMIQSVFHNEGHKILLPYIYLPSPFWKIRPQLTSHDYTALSLKVHPFNKMVLTLRLPSLALWDHTIQPEGCCLSASFRSLYDPKEKLWTKGAPCTSMRFRTEHNLTRGPGQESLTGRHWDLRPVTALVIGSPFPQRSPFRCPCASRLTPSKCQSDLFFRSLGWWPRTESTKSCKLSYNPIREISLPCFFSHSSHLPYVPSLIPSI